jgi:hypothetical protein
MTISTAKPSAITTASPLPSALPPPGEPTITPTPSSATSIATDVRRLTGSPSSARPSSAASTGAIDWMKSTCATEAWFSATMNAPEATAQTHRKPQAGIAERAARFADPAAFDDRDVSRHGYSGKQRPSRHLRRHAHRQLALKHARRRPHHGSQRDRDLTALGARIRRLDRR